MCQLILTISLSLLYVRVPTKNVFIFETIRYQNDYVRDGLWNELFLRYQELLVSIKPRHIHNLVSLQYYFSKNFVQYH